MLAATLTTGTTINIKDNMKQIKLLFLITTVTSLSSCVVMTVGQYESQKKAQALKDNKSELHQLLLKNSFENDTCNLSSLLRILGKNINRLSTTELDEFRINILKDELIKSYKMYQYKDLPFVFSEKDLETKMSCYLDYILNPKYEYVPFWVFWKDSYYLKFPCKN